MATGWKRWICLAWLLLVPLSGNAVTPMIAAGTSVSVFLNSDGSVWGTGSVAGATSPVRIFQLVNVTAVAGGSLLEYGACGVMKCAGIDGAGPGTLGAAAGA